MAEAFPELPTSGLVLWRLAHPRKQQVECSVTLNYRGDLALTVRNVPSCRVIVAEAHANVRALMQHADDLRLTFFAGGWRMAEKEAEDEPAQ